MPIVWYHVRDLDASRRFYRDTLGFSELELDGDVVRLQKGDTEVALVRGEPQEGAVAHVEVDDAKAEAERLRAAGVRVGVVFELHGEMRLVDVFDPDGNRIQLAQELSEEQ